MSHPEQENEVYLGDGDKRMVALHNKLVAAVKAMIVAVQEHSRVRTLQERTGAERRISATDRAIDALVYELYGLDESERAVVDAAVAPEENTVESMTAAK